MKLFSGVLKHSVHCLRYATLPILLAIYPPLFHYGNNVLIAQFASLEKLLALFMGIALILYTLFCLALRGSAIRSANATFAFLVFFHVYGLIFNSLRSWDKVQVEHYILLPILILIGLYASWSISKINDKLSWRIWTSISLVLGILIVFNIIKIVPVEIRKTIARGANPIAPASDPTAVASQDHPDIYYLVLDEMVGFDAMRQYWGYEGIDNFVNFLKSKNFYVAENSHSESVSTFHELAVRLNYQSYPYNPSDPHKYWDEDFQQIASNKVMQYLKSLGYTIVIFDEVIPPTEPYDNADIVYAAPLNEMMSWGSIFDDFGRLVIDNTMILPFVPIFRTETSNYASHERMLYFTLQEVTNTNISSPKFVYVHLLIPHVPFLYDEKGHSIDPQYYNSWEKYYGYYIYATQYSQTLIENIFRSADTNHPPVIIFQSDHGARNFQLGPNDKLLENFPPEYQLLIVNAFYLPNCDGAPLTQDVDPINTFPIVFNCYFDAGIPLK